MAGNPKRREREKLQNQQQTGSPVFDFSELLDKLAPQDMERIAKAWLKAQGIDHTSLPSSRKWSELPQFRLPWMAPFLLVLRDTANVRSACNAAGIARRTAYDAREADEHFRSWWDEAIEDAVDSLEMSALALAARLDGPMIRYLLQAHRPSVYKREMNLKHQGDPDQPVQVQHTHQVAVYLPDNKRGDRVVDVTEPRLLEDGQPAIPNSAFTEISPGSLDDTIVDMQELADLEEDEEL